MVFIFYYQIQGALREIDRQTFPWVELLGYTGLHFLKNSVLVLDEIAGNCPIDEAGHLIQIARALLAILIFIVPL